MDVTPEILLDGLIFSTEAALMFLRDANAQYRDSRFASACVLGANAQEHLGRAVQLFEIHLELKNKRRPLDIADFKRNFEKDHEDKLRSSLSIVSSPRLPSSLSLDWLEKLPHQESPEFQSKAQDIMIAIEKQLKREPGRIHRLRCEAQYVELSDDGSKWNRPAQVDPSNVHDMLLDAGNCYHGIFIFRLKPYLDFSSRCRELGVWESLNSFSNTFPPPEGDIQ